LERGPYGPKINRNLIKGHLQVFCDNPGGFQQIVPGAENRVLELTKIARNGRFQEKIKFEPDWPGDQPWWCYALNFGQHVEEGPFE
jgi:hypothetical protein